MVVVSSSEQSEYKWSWLDCEQATMDHTGGGHWMERCVQYHQLRSQPSMPARSCTHMHIHTATIQCSCQQPYDPTVTGTLLTFPRRNAQLLETSAVEMALAGALNAHPRPDTVRQHIAMLHRKTTGRNRCIGEKT